MLSTAVFNQNSGCKRWRLNDPFPTSQRGFMRLSPLLLNPQRKEGVEKRSINVTIVIDCQCHNINKT